MSKLIDAIEVIQRSGPIAPRTKVPPVLGASDKINDLRFANKFEYQIAVRLGFASVVSSQAGISEAKDLVRREIAEFVFGEFRQPLIDLEHALWDGDAEAAREILREIRKAMFP